MRFFYLVIFTLFFLPLSSVLAEDVRLFESDIVIHDDSSFIVTETIHYDFGTLFRHGIFRKMDLVHPQESTVWYKDRRVEVEINEVLMDGKSVPYDITTKRVSSRRSSNKAIEQLQIQIGDPDEEITGEHEYVITYKVIGGLSYYDSGIVELYWNITGSEWPQVIRRTVATVQNPNNVLKKQRACFSGPPGVTDSCAIFATSTYTSFTSPLLPPGYQLTIAQELSAGIVDTVILEDIPAAWKWGSIGFIWFIIVGWFVYRYRTAHKPYQTVVSQYEPFEDFRPMFTGVLIDGKLDQKDITAGLLYLAQQGFMKIAKTEKKVMLFFEVSDYNVTLLRAVDEVETQFQKDVLLLLFDTYDAVGKEILLSKLKKDTSKLKANQKALQKLRNAVMEDLDRRGYFERILSISGAVGIVFVAFFVAQFSFVFLSQFLGEYTFPTLVIVVGTFIIVAFAYQRRTKKGYAALNHLKGFKEFLSVTEKERYAFHNAPAKSPEQFMEFLPYAVAFGVEDKWAEVFKDITIPNPEWYDGGNGMNSAFAATSLTSDLGAFSSSFSSSSTPASSGSGGGGMAGGGGGGGGGGSW